ncbi:MAG: protein kinase, partial [Myxococcota bacterium]
MPVSTAQPRWSIYAQVEPARSRIDSEWNAVNISRSGVFVAGEPLLKAGSKLDVILHLPGVYGPSVQLSGRVEVVWNRPPREASRERPAGMGCRFVQLEPQSRETLDAFISELQEHRPADSGGWPTGGPPATPPPPPQEAQEEEIIALEEIVTQSPVRVASQSALASPPSMVESFKGEPLPKIQMPQPEAPIEKLGPYHILRTLGTGGMGEVFLAEHALIGRRVAIKRLHDQFSRDPNAVRRFFDEAKLINQISHPNIVEVTDLVCDERDLYYVMELIEGTTLLEEIKREVGLPLTRVLHIGEQLADALDAVHGAGIIHRDLKPDNVLLTTRHGQPDRVKLLDFGIAKLRVAHEQNNRNTVAGFVVGTPGYMSPEQIMGQPLDTRTDIYGLGVLLHEMVGGKRAFTGKSFGELMLKQSTQVPAPPKPPRGPDIPTELKTLIVGCLRVELEA